MGYQGAHHDNLSHDEGSPGPRATRIQICTWYSSWGCPTSPASAISTRETAGSLAC